MVPDAVLTAGISFIIPDTFFVIFLPCYLCIGCSARLPNLSVVWTEAAPTCYDPPQVQHYSDSDEVEVEVLELEEGPQSQTENEDRDCICDSFLKSFVSVNKE